MTELIRRPETQVLAFVINSLRFGPAHVPSLIAEARARGFTAPQMTKAAHHLGIIRHRLEPTG